MPIMGNFSDKDNFDILNKTDNFETIKKSIDLSFSEIDMTFDESQKKKEENVISFPPKTPSSFRDSVITLGDIGESVERKSPRQGHNSKAQHRPNSDQYNFFLDTNNMYVVKNGNLIKKTKISNLKSNNIDHFISKLLYKESLSKLNRYLSINNNNSSSNQPTNSDLTNSDLFDH